MTQTVPAPARERRRPVDPRLLRYARASRSFFVLIGVIGAAQTAVIVAIAWLLTHAITGAIDGMPIERARRDAGVADGGVRRARGAALAAGVGLRARGGARGGAAALAVWSMRSAGSARDGSRPATPRSWP